MNSILRGFVLFVLLLVGFAIEAAAQNAEISLSISGSLSGIENNNNSLGNTLLNISQAQKSAVTIKLCATSSQPTVGLRFLINFSTPAVFDASGCFSVQINTNKSFLDIVVSPRTNNAIDEPLETVTVMVSEDADSPLPSNVSINTDANSVVYTIIDDDPTIVSLARTGSASAVAEGGTVEFTVTLGHALIAGEIIDAPLTVSGTNVTTADWSLTTKSGSSLNTGITLVNETTAAPVVRFSGAAAQTAPLCLPHHRTTPMRSRP